MRSGNGRRAEGGPGGRAAGPWAEEAPEPRLVLTPPADPAVGEAPRAADLTPPGAPAPPLPPGRLCPLSGGPDTAPPGLRPAPPARSGATSAKSLYFPKTPFPHLFSGDGRTNEAALAPGGAPRGTVQPLRPSGQASAVTAASPRTREGRGRRLGVPAWARGAGCCFGLRPAVGLVQSWRGGYWHVGNRAAKYEDMVSDEEAGRLPGGEAGRAQISGGPAGLSCQDFILGAAAAGARGPPSQIPLTVVRSVKTALGPLRPFLYWLGVPRASGCLPPISSAAWQPPYLKRAPGQRENVAPGWTAQATLGEAEHRGPG